MCRSVSLGAPDPQMPDLWLELRPTRAFAANPRVETTFRVPDRRSAGRHPYCAE